ncbi:hypothetical protein [Tahibacter harae]|uniref:Uncharacterized protein n=1 Tax=Tahibacter harae TaxID=2963937 RepID=A0ABT1QLI3_9GAMM|nr:hypothetical protein [Tahibacter harae]MCQ4163317.1 hypothetical protein [Tahibacter harae]
MNAVAAPPRLSARFAAMRAHGVVGMGFRYLRAATAMRLPSAAALVLAAARGGDIGRRRSLRTGLRPRAAAVRPGRFPPHLRRRRFAAAAAACSFAGLSFLPRRAG